MSARFFLDTNVFVYELETSEPRKSEQATDLVREALRTRQGMTSYQVVQEFFSVAFNKFVQPLASGKAEDYLRNTFLPILAVHSSPRLFFDAIRIKNTHHFSWYDSLIVAAALENRCEILYSEDFQHGRKIEGLEIINPFL